MSVQPVSAPVPTPVGPGLPGPRPAAPGGVSVVLLGALLLQLIRSLPLGTGGPGSSWNSWLAVVLPVLALPAALLWWVRSPVTAQRLLPVTAGIALVPAAVLALVPSVARSMPDVLVTVLTQLGLAALWTVPGLVLVCAVSLAASGRIVAAGAAAALTVLVSLVASTVLGSLRELALPSQVYPLLLLVGAVAVIAGGSTIRRADGDDRAVPGPTALATVLGILTVVVPYLVTYFVLSGNPGGPLGVHGWFAILGVVLAAVALAGAALLGREAVLLVLGAGLLLGCLSGLTTSVGAGLGRGWWLPVLVLLVLVGAAAVATARRAREIGLTAIAVLVTTLVATYLVVEFGHLDEGLEIALTLMGLVAGALAGGCVVGALAPRVLRADDLVPVVLLTLALGSGVTRVLTWGVQASDIERNTSLLWICGLLVLAAAAVLTWPRSVRTSSADTTGTGTGPGVTPAGDQLHGAARPAPPAW